MKVPKKHIHNALEKQATDMLKKADNAEKLSKVKLSLAQISKIFKQK